MLERKAIPSLLGDSPLSAPTADEYRPIRMMPDLRVLKIGGQSVMDRGRAAVFPILKEILAAKEEGIQMMLMAGGGTRARHIYSIASSLDMPTGVLAKLGGYVAMQNARMLQMLLANEGGVYMLPDDFEKVPLYVRLGCIPVTSGMPPFEYWEKPTGLGNIPQHRTDAGTWLTAEVFGIKRCLFVKDEDGLFTDDPKKNANAEFIPRISAAELIERDLVDVVVERVVIEYLQRAKHCTELQIVNGLKPGVLSAALRGEDVGTIIHA